MSAPAGQLSPAQLQAINAQARGLILANSLQMTQQIQSVSVNPTNQPTVVINPRNVGLIKGFIVEVDGQITNNGSTTSLTRTGFGASNVLTNVQFNDLNNIVRINTSGRHLAMLNTVRSGAAYGGAYAPAIPISLGNNFPVQVAPATIAPADTQAVRFIYWVPIAYASNDLRGAIYAATVNATMQLQLTINANPVIASGDPLKAMYTGNTGAWVGNVTITVYQQYFDQLPTGSNGVPILPPLDLNNYYQLLETNISGMVAGTDFPYGYANFRDYYSTMITYDNAGVFNTGTDVNYFSLVSSNLTQIFKITPQIAALWSRQATLQDMPPGCYWFDSRGGGQNPINTVNFGNMQINLNASAVTTGASEYVATEAFGQITQVSTVTGPSSASAG